MLLIATDGQGCHYKAFELSQNRYHRPKYMEAFYNSIEMIFKKLKYHKGKMDITITEVEDYGTTKENETKEQAGAANLRKSRRNIEVRHLETDGSVQTFNISNSAGDTGV